ncbi:hypothetical protein BV898_00046 [Hypsibius exemplaris]|uniref:Uncharacterized protein n=1 Tax=Hypsibius exemplaris TaxID=2072580 RepID=A0A1W0XEK9_HYPEX|nr:hypothetical protein BV898_00046 [Hypsibius exemplaris]
MTHSYTIMITTDAIEKLVSPHFFDLQEITGDKFGPQVPQELFAALNILVTATSSGKMKKEYLKLWLEMFYFLNASN